MFEEINKHKVKIKDVQSKDRQLLYYLPNIISMGPLDDLLKATEWLVKESVDDYNKTYKQVHERRKKEGYSQKNLDEIEELSIRLGSRTQGYINQVCLMEDILIFEYKRMAELIGLASDNKLSFVPADDYKLLLQRLSQIRIFRNKVVAHTAYTDPKIINKKTGELADNPETTVRSILNLFPEPGGITLGNNMFSGFSQHRSQLPIITIFNWGPEIRPILVDWQKLFIERLQKLHSECPYQNKQYSIEIGYPHLVKRGGKKKV